MRAVAVRAAIGTVVAVVLALVVFAVARATGEDLAVSPAGMGETTVAWPAVVASTVVGGVMGLVLAVLARLTPRPRAVLLGVGLVGLLLSFANPALATDSAATIVWLCLMHVVVAAAVLGALAGVLPARKGSPASQPG